MWLVQFLDPVNQSPQVREFPTRVMALAHAAKLEAIGIQTSTSFVER